MIYICRVNVRCPLWIILLLLIHITSMVGAVESSSLSTSSDPIVSTGGGGGAGKEWQSRRELQSIVCDKDTIRCEELGKDGRRMHRDLGFYCREQCVWLNWQGVRRRFGWRCGGCDDR